MRWLGLFSLSLALATLAASPARAQTSEPTVLQIMLGLTVPASGTLLDVKEPPGDDDLYWLQVEAAAVMLAESGKMLQKPSIAGDDQRWMANAQQLVDAAMAAAELARTRDAKAVVRAGIDVYNVCDGCHAEYLTGGQ